ncbi:hypothetical protein CHGG_02735 [Chaetomium globosum CBS 148.51]|uniref:Gpi-anchored protein n=1 Tax=Chaetomium globosum (strain ATCC 6205 / CBS 148.51 / DSM 1962 / NBRC 6347 / NRRL 1970) TaxID=306901 RepID=Q2HAL9_CHAGB|nr:uncharacterized protein CHGG_02735 [Chaetomium globosum CBS 148.51]EAQ90800.1 hypothetical protein CHGG_02735 [Chaetomium globosum CBS 148.51]
MGIKQLRYGRNPGGLFLVLAWASVVCASLQPFQPVETAAPVAKRQESGCLANFFSCADQGPAFDGVCCQNGQRCALDASDSPACCPTNAVCTGTAPESFVPPGPAATTAASYVPNVFFSFPYVATYFANPGHCSAAISQCNANHAACTSQLAGQDGSGAGYAVTVVVPGGGEDDGDCGGRDQRRRCRRYEYFVACGDLRPSMCTMTGTSTDGFYFGTDSGNAAARPTGAAACAGLVGAVAAGVAGLGIL